MSVVAVYAPTEMRETEEMLYTKLYSLLDKCPYRDAFIVVGKFNDVTGSRYMLSLMALVPGTTTALSF